jgi:hypothetical protein
MTCSNLLNGIDTWICASCKVDVSSLVIPGQFCNSYISFVSLQIDEFQIWVKEQWEKAKVTMMKSPSKEEKVVDMKAAAQQSRGATWQLSVEATRPPGDGAGAGATGAGAGRPAGAEEGMLFETLPIFYPPSFQEEYSDTSTNAGSKYLPPKHYQKSTSWSIEIRSQARKDSDKM